MVSPSYEKPPALVTRTVKEESVRFSNAEQPEYKTNPLEVQTRERSVPNLDFAAEIARSEFLPLSRRGWR
jgi:hypothetical protein